MLTGFRVGNFDPLKLSQLASVIVLTVAAGVAIFGLLWRHRE